MMMHTALSVALLIGSTLGHPQAASTDDIYANWKPPGPDDLRGPCPMLNTLANHGFLPRDGGAKEGFTVDMMVKAMGDALHFEPDLSQKSFTAGLVVNPNNTADSWNLKQLRSHNVLEHDASLSRADDYWTGNGWAFDQATFDETKSYWTDPILNKTLLARAKIARQVKSKFTNPQYFFNKKAETFSLGEVLSFAAAFGDKDTFTVRRDFLVYWFENERFPTHLGWTRPAEMFTGADQSVMNTAISIESSLQTDFEGI